MKLNSFLFGILFLFFSVCTFAQLPSPALAVPIAVTPAVSAAPVIAQAPAPIVIPDWAINILKNAKSLPVVGPALSQIMMYVGILGGILTSLIAFLLTVLSSVSGIAGLSGAANLVQKIQDFKNSKLFMWLMAFSNIPMAHPNAVAEMKQENAVETVTVKAA